jgi:hypothetical protein
MNLEVAKQITIDGVNLGKCLDILMEVYNRVGPVALPREEFDCDVDVAWERLVHTVGDIKKAEYILKCGALVEKFREYMDNIVYRSMAEMFLKQMGIEVDLDGSLSLVDSPCFKKLRERAKKELVSLDVG